MFDALNWNMLFSLLTAALVAYIAIPPIVRVARKKQLVDLPNGRTSHNGAVPSLGGIAIFAAVSIGANLFYNEALPEAMKFIVPALVIIFFVGMKDDMVNLGAYKKIGAQIIAAVLIVVFAKIRITTFHGFLGIGSLENHQWLSIGFSLFVFIALINAFNLIDGIDGLASGLGIQISMVLGVWLAYVGSPNFAILAFALTGALIPFYIFNVFGKKYKLFMGDTGSLLIGALVAILSMKAICCEFPVGHILEVSSLPVIAVAVLIIPIVDTLKVFTMRIANGKSPFSADRIHLHHDLLRLGLTHWQASTIIVLCNFGIFLFAFFFREVNSVLLTFLVLGLGFLSCMVPRFLPSSLQKPVEEFKEKVAYAK